MNTSSHMRDESLSKECVNLLNNTLKTMTKRNLKQELCYYTYTDMERGEDIENIHYPALIGLLGELIGRVEALERELEYQKEYAMEQNERYG